MRRDILDYFVLILALLSGFQRPEIMRVAISEHSRVGELRINGVHYALVSLL